MTKKEVQSTYKSEDTEEWLDRVWTRPIGYWWARRFEKWGVHPNTVTVLSMVIGAGSALFFAHGSYRTEGISGWWLNVAAVIGLAWANFYDSADGQLARMTGKKTRLGRILDGAASEVWFIPIYLSLVYRFYVHHDLEFQWLGVADTAQHAAMATALFLLIALYAGFRCHSRQCGLADYYRQIHLYFLKGEAGSELDNSAQQQRLYEETPWKGNRLWKAFLKTYVNYTRSQEKRTPEFQQLMQQLAECYGSMEHIPDVFRDRFRTLSLPLMKYTNILTFNTRAVVLYAVCLADIPWMYFFFEIFILGGLCRYMWRRHERMCRVLCEELQRGVYSQINS